MRDTTGSQERGKENVVQVAGNLEEGFGEKHTEWLNSLDRAARMGSHRVKRVAEALGWEHSRGRDMEKVRAEAGRPALRRAGGPLSIRLRARLGGCLAISLSISRED